jgi:hypothetical protein
MTLAKKTTSTTRSKNTTGKTTTPRVTKPKPVQKLPPNPFMNEILELVCSQKTKEDKIRVLKEYQTPALMSLFIWNYDDSVISVLPEGEVPYQPNESPLGVDHSSLRKDYRNLYNFVKGGNDSLSKVRRETIFIQILESLHPSEAEILILVKDKKLETKYPVGFDVVQEAYPEIKWGGRS